MEAASRQKWKDLWIFLKKKPSRDLSLCSRPLCVLILERPCSCSAFCGTCRALWWSDTAVTSSRRSVRRMKEWRSRLMPLEVWRDGTEQHALLSVPVELDSRLKKNDACLPLQFTWKAIAKCFLVVSANGTGCLKVTKKDFVCRSDDPSGVGSSMIISTTYDHYSKLLYTVSV